MVIYTAWTLEAHKPIQTSCMQAWHIRIGGCLGPFSTSSYSPDLLGPCFRFLLHLFYTLSKRQPEPSKVFNMRACQLIRESFPVCPELCRQPVSPSTPPSTLPTHTHTDTRVHISPTNREVSLGEAAAVAGVTALLKSETLVPVNSNLALRLPLSHSVHPFQHAHTHTTTRTNPERGAERRADGRGGCVLSGELKLTALGERGDREEE